MNCTVDKCNRLAGYSMLCKGHEYGKEYSDKPTKVIKNFEPLNKGICLVDKCYTTAKTKGLCRQHYQDKRETDNPCRNIWRGIINRCTSPEVASFPEYGGRGIKVCERWLNSYENFITDMGNRPSPKHSIDRINTNGNYEPENCRWAISSQQSSNRRNNLPRPGVSKSGYRRWLAHMIVDGKVVLNKTFLDYEEACNARAKAEQKYW